MPFSKRQLRWSHTPTGREALDDATVKKWEQEAKGKQLPETSKGAHEKDLKRKFRKAVSRG